MMPLDALELLPLNPLRGNSRAGSSPAPGIGARFAICCVRRAKRGRCAGMDRGQPRGGLPLRTAAIAWAPYICSIMKPRSGLRRNSCPPSTAKL
jgi:hypothetical protein